MTATATTNPTSSRILGLAETAKPVADWWPEERRTWRPPEALTVSEWADRSRVLPGKVGARHGPWRTDRTPYMREILDAFADRTVERITVRKSTQVGGTELLLNVLGYASDQDPQPAVVVVPREKDAKAMMRRRILPTFRESPDLARHMTGAGEDETVAELVLDASVIYVVTSQSPADLASKAAGVLLGDEADKWPGYTGDEAGPWDLAVERTRTFPRRKIALNSTPVFTTGLITREFLDGDQRYYHVPCPHCGAWQPLEWERVRWPAELEADREQIVRDRAATYACVGCDEPIHERERPRMLRLGVWVPKGATVIDIGGEPVVELEGAPRTHRSYQLSALYSPWVTWSQLVADWLRLRETDEGRQHFTNSLLGLPWEEVLEAPTRAGVLQHVRAYPRDSLPEGHSARVITIGCDVQARHLVYTVRAWGWLGESWLLRAGTTRSWETFEALCRGTWCGLPVRMVCIDARHRTEEVEEFARRNRELVTPIKGVDRTESGALYTARRVDRDPRTGRALPNSLLVWSVDVHQFRDRFLALLHGELEEGPRAWHLHVDPQEEYLHQVAAMEKVRPKRGTSRDARAVWQLKAGHRRKDWFDAEVYALVAATMIRADNIGHTQHGRPGGTDDDPDLPPGAPGSSGGPPQPPKSPRPRAPRGRRPDGPPPGFLDVLRQRR